MKLTPEQIAEIEASVKHVCGAFCDFVDCEDIRALLAHIRALQDERDAAVKGLREELKIVNAKNSGRTHYAGCEENHALCAVARRLDAALKSAGAEP